MDRIQLVAVVAALVLDVMVPGAMIAWIGDLGFTPNRTAAWAERGIPREPWRMRMVIGPVPRHRTQPFHRLERWQTTHLPVFAGWAAPVVIILPPLLAFD